MIGTLDKEMFSYFLQLSEEEKISVVQMLKVFLNGRPKSSKRVSVEQYNRELDEAMEEVKRGEVYSHEEVEKMSKNW